MKKARLLSKATILALAGWMSASQAHAGDRYPDDGVYYGDGTPYGDQDYSGGGGYDGPRDSRYDGQQDSRYYDNGDDYGYDDDSYNSSQNADADIYYENYYGADNPYDLYFHRRLSSHGEWVYARGCGWVWRPFVVSSWSPYSLGYWGWSNHGWTWVSYEPFGSIVYHYGNWAYLDNYGWCWFPGYQWYPHTVTWSSWDGYIGWCPRPPRMYGNSGYHYDYDHNYRRYNWVSNRNFLDRDLSRRVEHPADLWRRHGDSRDLPILSDPSRSSVEHWSGRTPQSVVMEQIHMSTRKGDVQMFVPDRQTRDWIRREGQSVVSPWVDTQRRDENRQHQPRWTRDKQHQNDEQWTPSNGTDNEWWRNHPRDEENQQTPWRGSDRQDQPQQTPWVNSHGNNNGGNNNGQHHQDHGSDDHAPRSHDQPAHSWTKGGSGNSGGSGGSGGSVQSGSGGNKGGSGSNGSKGGSGSSGSKGGKVSTGWKKP